MLHRHYAILVTLLVVVAGPVVPVTALSSSDAQQTATFAVSNLQAPTQVKIGQQVTAKAVITNTGNASGPTTVQYRIGGSVVASTTVALAPGASTTVVLRGTVPTLAAGSYQQGVFIGNTNEGQTASVIVGSLPAQFSVLSLQAPSEAEPGDSITVTATIRNTGGSSGSTAVEYRIGDRTVESQELSIGAGQRTDVTFQVTVPTLAAGTYQQGVFIGDSANGLTSELRLVRPEASFALTTLRGPSRAAAGDSVTAEVTVRNTGDARGSTTLEYRIDGRRVATESVTLDAGASRTVTLRGTVPDRPEGIYTQGVFVDGTDRGLSANLRIIERPAAAFRVSDLRAPSRVETNADITIRATVRNTGERTGRATVQYRIGSRVLGRRTLELRPERSTTVTFDVTVPNLSPGTYRQGVFVGDTDSGQTTSLRVTRAQPQVAVTGLQAPPSARIGNQISVQATLRNSGNASGTRTVEYRIGDRVVTSRRVEVPARSTRSVTLEGPVPSVTPGTYQQGVFVDGSAWRTSLEVKPRTEPRAVFAVSNLRAPASAVAGDRISVQATVRNTGNASGSTPVEYRFGDTIVGTKRVTLEPGAEQTVAFDVRVPDLSPGSYDHGVFVGDTATGASDTFELEAGSPRFAVSDLRGPATAEVGAGISVTATVTNTGTGPGETELQYRIDGEVAATDSVELDAGERTSVTFEVTVPELDAGTYRQGVFVGDTGQGQTSSLAVTVAATPTRTPSPTPTAETGPGFTALVAIVALLAVVGFAMRRRE